VFCGFAGADERAVEANHAGLLDLGDRHLGKRHGVAGAADDVVERVGRRTVSKSAVRLASSVASLLRSQTPEAIRWAAAALPGRGVGGGERRCRESAIRCVQARFELF